MSIIAAGIIAYASIMALALLLEVLIGVVLVIASYRANGDP